MTWCVDGRTFAKKVKDPTLTFTTNGGTAWSEITECPSCGYAINRGNVAQDWPGLPAGVKFDPSDVELLEHLAAKTGYCDSKPHPFIDEFIPTLDGKEGICYAHPEYLPGIRNDGSSMHYFHMSARAYNTGSRKRRKINSSYESRNKGEVRWHKTGKTRPIIDNGKQLGCKKIMVLYLITGKGTKPQKTNWVMHQYHLGSHEEESEGELVVSKVFYQTQPRIAMGSSRGDDFLEQMEMEIDGNTTYSFPHTSASAVTSLNSQGTPATPQSLAHSHPYTEKKHRSLFESMSEEVDRLTASLNGNALTANWLLHQVVAYDNPQKGAHMFRDTGTSMEMPARPSQSNQLSSIVINVKPTSNISAEEDICNTVSDFKLTLDNMLEEESRPDPAPLENIVLDTPPELQLESLLNSQDTLDWLGSRKFGDSQPGLSIEGLNEADYILDSQSST